MDRSKRFGRGSKGQLGGATYRQECEWFGAWSHAFVEEGCVSSGFHMPSGVPRSLRSHAFTGAAPTVLSESYQAPNLAFLFASRLSVPAPLAPPAPFGRHQSQSPGILRHP